MTISRRKAELRGAALDYLLGHGVANVSLRPMAAELGTSARILMFHFGSKEGLIGEVMEELQSRLQASFVRVAADSGGDAPLMQFWKWAMDKKNLPYLRLLYEAQIVAVQNEAEYGRYLKKASADWQALAFRALSKAPRSEEMATLCVAVFDGLLLELMVTGDRRRLTRALERFLAMASASASGVPVSCGKSYNK